MMQYITNLSLPRGRAGQLYIHHADMNFDRIGLVEVQVEGVSQYFEPCRQDWSQSQRRGND